MNIEDIKQQAETYKVLADMHNAIVDAINVMPHQECLQILNVKPKAKLTTLTAELKYMVVGDAESYKELSRNIKNRPCDCRFVTTSLYLDIKISTKTKKVTYKFTYVTANYPDWEAASEDNAPVRQISHKLIQDTKDKTCAGRVTTDDNYIHGVINALVPALKTNSISEIGMVLADIGNTKVLNILK